MGNVFTKPQEIVPGPNENLSLDSLATRIKEYHTLLAITHGAVYQSVCVKPERNKVLESNEALKNNYRNLTDLLQRAFYQARIYENRPSP